jgi:hypothetical protein
MTFPKRSLLFAHLLFLDQYRFLRNRNGRSVSALNSQVSWAFPISVPDLAHRRILTGVFFRSKGTQYAWAFPRGQASAVFPLQTGVRFPSLKEGLALLSDGGLWIASVSAQIFLLSHINTNGMTTRSAGPV